jgi:hypothetical protein
VPRNKTTQAPRPYSLFTSHDVENFSPDAKKLRKEHGACICCPQGILRAFRGHYDLKCEDMPWRCPFKPSPPTPVV